LSASGSNPFHPSRRPLAAILPLFLCRVQLPISLGLNLLLVPGEHFMFCESWLMKRGQLESQSSTRDRNVKAGDAAKEIDDDAAARHAERFSICATAGC
jgi:hypothetical protein